ncbi:MAG TPA: hypothetical protein VMT43_08550 [Acidimicrobiales bacterium]|nr:hypothetical protein [Acidimicrobiales bacterium]
MTATTVPTPVSDSPPAHPLRVVFVALAIVVLLAASFVIGRVTVGTTTHSPAVAPPATVAPAAPAASSGNAPTTWACRMGRPC